MIEKLRLFLTSYFWILPFVAFLMGYQVVRYLTHTEAVAVPSVVGLHLSDAIRQLSADRLNVRILAEKEDPDLREATILRQTPEQGRWVKPHQAIFLVITRKPLKPIAPVFEGTLSDAKAKAQQARIQLATYHFETTSPYEQVVAQSILPTREVDDNTMYVYVSDGPSSLRIFPRLEGRTAEDVVSFFSKYAIPVEVQGESTAAIIDQRPVAGTLIDIRRPLTVRVTT